MTAETAVRTLALAAAAVLAAGAVVAAPAGELLERPDTIGEQLAAGAALFGVFAFALLAPLQGFFALVVLAVLEGALRKWGQNDALVFLLKDFLALGVYAAVLPQLTRRELVRPLWLLVPLAAVLLLALAYAPAAASAAQAAIGLRSYTIYPPLLWAAPALLRGPGRVHGLLGLVVALGAVQAALATLQALAGPGVLNRLVSGAEPGIVEVGSRELLRPSGTFMHVGTLAGFLLLAVMASAAVVAAQHRGLLLWAGIAAPLLLSWGVAYTGARALLASTVLVAGLLFVWLLARRRWLHVVALAAAWIFGAVLVFLAVPALDGPATALSDRLGEGRLEHRVLRLEEGGSVELEVDPEEVRPGGNADRLVRARDARGRELVLLVSPAGTVLVIEQRDEDAAPAGFLRRAADPRGGDVGVWESRIAPELRRLAAPRLLGHGTGSLTLGAQYAGAEPVDAEGYYAKLHWELGWPAVPLFLGFLAAVALAGTRSLRQRGPGEAAAAVAAVGLTLLLVPWLLLTYALDYPVVGIVFYSLAGLVSAGAVDRDDVRSSSSRAAASMVANPPGECSRST